MNDDQRLKLQNMIQEHDVADQTELIRQLKHSLILKNEVLQLVQIRENNKDSPVVIMEKGVQECSFLYNYYTDIFNRIRKDDIDIDLLFQFFDILEKIETGETNFHDASFQVGTLLTEIYVKSALKRSKKLDQQNQQEKPVQLNVKDISWQHFKKIKDSLQKKKIKKTK